jgi:transposase
MQQAQGMVLKVRETLIGQRTPLGNTVRGYAAEFGIVAGKGISKIAPLLFAIEQEVANPPEAKEMFALTPVERREGSFGEPAIRKDTNPLF